MYVCLFKISLTNSQLSLHLLTFIPRIHQLSFFIEELLQGFIITAQIKFICSTKITLNLCCGITINQVCRSALHSNQYF